MPKVDLELVKLVLQRNELDVRQVAQIIEDINVEMAALVEDEPKPTTGKKQFVMLVADPLGVLAGENFAGWVVQIPDTDAPATVLEKIRIAAAAYNASPKGRRLPVRDVAEALEVMTGPRTREYCYWVKTREPVFVVPLHPRTPFAEKL